MLYRVIAISDIHPVGWGESIWHKPAEGNIRVSNQRIICNTGDAPYELRSYSDAIVEQGVGLAGTWIAFNTLPDRFGCVTKIYTDTPAPGHTLEEVKRWLLKETAKHLKKS